jgi:hypothetical protein
MSEPNLMRMAILLALLETPGATIESLERRVSELLELGEEEMRRLGRAHRDPRPH